MYGEKIKQYLNENGIKYIYISAETGISMSTLSAMLNCKRKITVEEYFIICSVLEVDANYFAERVNDAS